MKDKRSLLPLEERLGVETLAVILMNFDGYDVQGYTEMLTGIGFRTSECDTFNGGSSDRGRPPMVSAIEEMVIEAFMMKIC
ncbi:hypothetical protein HAX54_032751 [Datura stramonium]|uniref:Uncharacterized protein n=1 Tax=Datura stramonium TaxID=4076 RepID=A0ABS8VE96_DATST|nr:hypothetical protein [Datura stramonium]